jgi:glycosyltransferase involved in cell wall biosynthesis
LDGGLSIGAKRQTLLDRSNGQYVCFLDDDDEVSPNYVESLLRMTFEEKDVCSFRCIAKLPNNWALIDMGLYNSNQQINPDTITRRLPWHICPVRSDYAKLHKFNDNSNYGEDWEWFSKVVDRCNTEAHTDKILFSYNQGKHSEADNIIKHT